IDQTMNRMQSLWAEWLPNDIQIGEWRGRLQPFDEDSVLQAINRYRNTRAGVFKKPNVFEFTEHCRACQQEMHGQSKKRGDNEPCLHYSLECTEHPTKPHYVGQRRKFYVSQRRMLPNENTTLTWAGIKQRQAEMLYGGKWIIIINDYAGKGR
ncbi:hypothetical protein LCGC14_1517010, partial [marine sediment metagenome]